MPAADLSPEQIENHFPEFCVEREIDVGGQKQVFLVKRKNKRFALKLILLEQGNIQRIQLSRINREIEAMEDVESPHLVKLGDAGLKRIDGGEYYYYIEDFIDGLTLYERIETGNFLNREEIINVGECILKAIDSLWKKGIVHRDIKPKNIILNNPSNAVLLDLGIAQFRYEPTITLVPHKGRGPGTPPFMAPEVLMYDKDRQCSRTDIFSLGITLIYSYSGTHPFNIQQGRDTITQNILNDNKIDLRQIFPLEENCLREVLDHMIKINTYERPRTTKIAIDELRSCL